MQLSLFDNLETNKPNKSKVNEKQLLYDLFQAYYDARRNKRNTKSVLQFEQNYESNLIELYNEIKNQTYKIKPSVCFINFRPVQREIFAADFRDRIVHHLVFNYISPIFERAFINDAYSCRIGKGTSYGIKRVDKFIKACSNNYKEDCYILKLDIKGYFMAINRNLLHSKTKSILEKYRYKNVNHIKGKCEKWNELFDFELIYYLLEKIIFNNPVENHIRKGNKQDWNGLPPSKSLFYSNIACGLPIGNLTSQLFSNIFLNDFDHWLKHQKNCKYYGRYVDDFVIIHSDKEFLKALIPKIRTYLHEKLDLELHPHKIYLQHFTKGVHFLGAIIKPYRIYLNNRTKGEFYKTIHKWNKFIESKQNDSITKNELELLVSSINSYLGIARQYNTFKLRKEIVLKHLGKPVWKFVYFTNRNKLKIKTYFT